MRPLTRNAAITYRQIDLDARVEASSSSNLTLICLEEAVSALGHALAALRRDPARAPQEPLARAHGIAMWLARSVAPDNPLRTALAQFYGGLAATIARNRVKASASELMQVRDDFTDLIAAAKKG